MELFNIVNGKNKHIALDDVSFGADMGVTKWINDHKEILTNLLEEVDDEAIWLQNYYDVMYSLLKTMIDFQGEEDCIKSFLNYFLNIGSSYYRINNSLELGKNHPIVLQKRLIDKKINSESDIFRFINYYLANIPSYAVYNEEFYAIKENIEKINVIYKNELLSKVTPVRLIEKLDSMISSCPDREYYRITIIGDKNIDLSIIKDYLFSKYKKEICTFRILVSDGNINEFYYLDSDQTDKMLFDLLSVNDVAEMFLENDLVLFMDCGIFYEKVKTDLLQNILNTYAVVSPNINHEKFSGSNDRLIGDLAHFNFLYKRFQEYLISDGKYKMSYIPNEKMTDTIRKSFNLLDEQKRPDVFAFFSTPALNYNVIGFERCDEFYLGKFLNVYSLTNDNSGQLINKYRNDGKIISVPLWKLIKNINDTYVSTLAELQRLQSASFILDYSKLNENVVEYRIEFSDSHNVSEIKQFIECFFRYGKGIADIFAKSMLSSVRTVEDVFVLFLLSNKDIRFVETKREITPTNSTIAINNTIDNRRLLDFLRSIDKRSFPVELKNIFMDLVYREDFLKMSKDDFSDLLLNLKELCLLYDYQSTKFYNNLKG